MPLPHLFLKQFDEVQIRILLEGKYHCFASLQFDWFGFSSFSTYKWQRSFLFGRIQTSQTGDQPRRVSYLCDLHTYRPCLKRLMRFISSVSSGGSPGLVVIGDDSCWRGHGFKLRHHILDDIHFSH